jgi:hypothetical protein
MLLACSHGYVLTQVLVQYADSLPAVQLVDGSDLNVDELEAAATLRVNKVLYCACRACRACQACQACSNHRMSF